MDDCITSKKKPTILSSERYWVPISTAKLPNRTSRIDQPFSASLLFFRECQKVADTLTKSWPRSFGLDPILMWDINTFQKYLVVA
mmetsp:Transcript_6978/g.12644  ORF Transcript_6978/g.12644 Transcript_6978/m.12644 type:complete len:85 (+) Transcript_6978:2853-3107(+)